MSVYPFLLGAIVTDAGKVEISEKAIREAWESVENDTATDIDITMDGNRGCLVLEFKQKGGAA